MATTISTSQIRALVSAVQGASDAQAQLAILREQMRRLYAPIAEVEVDEDVLQIIIGIGNVLASHTDEMLEANDGTRKGIYDDLGRIESLLGGRKGIERDPLVMKAVGETLGSKPDTILRCVDFGDGAVLTIGEVAVLSGQGGIGKSSIALQIAFDLASRRHDSCGMELYPDRIASEDIPVVYASAEDAEWVIKQRASRLADNNPRTQGKLPEALHYIDMRGRTLFEPEAGDYTGPPQTTADWDDLWAHVANVKARLVVVDPVMAVYAGNENRVVEVRMFISEFIKMCAKHECGGLLLAHNTKAARAKDSDPYDAGHVAGSASWTDAVRGVLSFTRPKREEGESFETWDDRRILRVLKANYGMSNIECELTAARVDPYGEPPNRAIKMFTAGNWKMPGQDSAAKRKGKPKGKAAIDADLNAEDVM